MRAFAGVAVALGASFVASTAWGHGARPSVFDIVERDGGVVGMATTFGVIHDGGDGLTWSCTAAVPATPTGYLFAGDDVIATTTDGLYVSDDCGCTWSEHPSDIAAPVVTEVRRDGADGGSTWLVTADLDAPNGVYRSDDDGRTWDAFGPTLDDTALYGLAVAEGRVVVTALNAEVGWSVLDWTADAAEPVADVPEGLLDVEVWIAGDRVWLADIRMRDSTFYGHDADTDAFVAWGDPVEGVITDVVEADGDVLVATDTSDVYRATPAGLERLEGESGACFVDDAPGATLRCGTTEGGVAMWIGPVGASEPGLAFDAVAPAACIYDEAHPCAPVAEFASDFLGEPADTGSSGSGCAVSRNRGAGSSALFAVALAALVIGRRRVHRV